MRGCSERTSVRATSMAWRTPFPPSGMPASIETSIKLVCVKRLHGGGCHHRVLDTFYGCYVGQIPRHALYPCSR